MRTVFQSLPALAFVMVMVCWFVFAGVFIFRKKPPSTPDRKRDRGSILGVALQGVSYGLIWGVHRQLFTPIVSGSELRDLISKISSVLAIVAAIGSVLMITAAVKVLGKEWSITARVVEEHKLATTGPYAFVRHPIYTGMLGMLVATGLVLSHWIALLAALVIFFVGTTIRMRSEEKLLRETFGRQFEDYSSRVRAIVPGLY